MCCPERLRIRQRSLLCVLLPPVTRAGLSQASRGGAAACSLSWDPCRGSWPWGCPRGAASCAGCEAKAQLADPAVPCALSVGTEPPCPVPSAWAPWVSVPQGLQGPYEAAGPSACFSPLEAADEQNIFFPRL